jgi:hypothetical protein
MQQSIKYIRKNREMFLNLINNLSIEQLNKIPEGFNNNIIWNFGHVIVSTQILAYVRSGVKPDSDIRFKEKFGRYSKPESLFSQEEIDELKALAVSTINQMEEDMKNNIFANMIPFATDISGSEINTFDELLLNILSHEFLHFGYALAQRKLVVV